VVAIGFIEPLDYRAEAIYTVILSFYVLLVIFATLPVYKLLVSRGVSENSARYYSRKLIHMFAGGIVAVLVPHLYTSPLFPLLASVALALLLVLARRYRPFYWFQAPNNMFEVNFVLAWGLTIFILWHVFPDPFVAVLPAIFISYGDAVTGIVRNAIFGYRTKHWYGNIAMAIVCLPVGFLYAGFYGLLAAIVAVIVERFEIGPVDDNILIAFTSTAILAYPYIGYIIF